MQQAGASAAVSRSLPVVRVFFSLRVGVGRQCTLCQFAFVLASKSPSPRLLVPFRMGEYSADRPSATGFARPVRPCASSFPPGAQRQGLLKCAEASHSGSAGRLLSVPLCRSSCLRVRVGRQCTLFHFTDDLTHSVPLCHACPFVPCLVPRCQERGVQGRVFCASLLPCLADCMPGACGAGGCPM